MRPGKVLIPRYDLAFVYELRQEGLPWKLVERHSGYKKSTIIKSLKMAGA